MTLYQQDREMGGGAASEETDGSWYTFISVIPNVNLKIVHLQVFL